MYGVTYWFGYTLFFAPPSFLSTFSIMRGTAIGSTNSSNFLTIKAMKVLLMKCCNKNETLPVGYKYFLFSGMLTFDRKNVSDFLGINKVLTQYDHIELSKTDIQYLPDVVYENYCPNCLTIRQNKKFIPFSSPLSIVSHTQQNCPHI
jgi:hypothetical protein